MEKRDEVYGSILPKTLVGVAAWILIFALGFSLSGVIFFAIYQSRINSLEDRILQTEQEFDKRLEQKVKELESEIESSGRTSPQSLRVSTSESERLTSTVSSSVARVEGEDNAGKRTKGSGVVVKSTGSESWILTNEHLVAGSAAKSLPVRVRVGRAELDSEVYATDPARNLALVIFRAGGMRAIPFSKTQPEKDSEAWVVGTKTGPIFGTNANRVKITGIGAFGLEFDGSNLDPVFSGGALLDSDAKALGIISIKGSSPPMAVPIRLACSIVLRCPNPAAKPTPSPRAGGIPASGAPPPAPSSPPADVGTTNDTF